MFIFIYLNIYLSIIISISLANIVMKSSPSCPNIKSESLTRSSHISSLSDLSINTSGTFNFVDIFFESRVMISQRWCFKKRNITGFCVRFHN